SVDHEHVHGDGQEAGDKEPAEPSAGEPEVPGEVLPGDDVADAEPPNQGHACPPLQCPVLEVLPADVLALDCADLLYPGLLLHDAPPSPVPRRVDRPPFVCPTHHPRVRMLAR